MYTTNGPKVPSSSHSSGHRVCSLAALRRSTGCLRAHRGRMRRADCTWHSKDNSRDVYACAPALHFRGNTWQKAAELNQGGSVTDTTYTVSVSRLVCPTRPFACYCENKDGHFISMAAWAPMCRNVLLLRRVPGQTDIPGISVHNAIQHSCTKKS